MFVYACLTSVWRNVCHFLILITCTEIYTNLVVQNVSNCYVSWTVSSVEIYWRKWQWIKVLAESILASVSYRFPELLACMSARACFGRLALCFCWEMLHWCSALWKSIICILKTDLFRASFTALQEGETNRSGVCSKPKQRREAKNALLVLFLCLLLLLVTAWISVETIIDRCYVSVRGLLIFSMHLIFVILWLACIIFAVN